MITEINAAALREALVELQLNGYTNHDITELSGVHNIQLIIDGKIKAPTFKSWSKLHNAFPDIIPPPSFIRDDKVYEANIVQKGKANNLHQAARDMVVSNSGGLTAKQQVLIDWLNKNDQDEKHIDDILAKKVFGSARNM